ncbi:MAG: hypothetical protein EHM91_15870, partial [Planctomycetota bacterium]
MRRPRWVPPKDRKKAVVGICGHCGKVGYPGRKPARKMLRVLHPDQVGVDMHIYECRAGGAPLWHIGNTPEWRREQMRHQPALVPATPPLNRKC